MFMAPPAPRAAEAGLHFIADDQRPVVSAERLRTSVKIVRGEAHALALHRLENEGGDVAPREPLLEGSEIAERKTRAIGQQRAEAFLKMNVAHERERPIRQPMEGAFERDESGTARRGPRKLDRAFHRFRAGVAKENGVQMRGRFLEQRFREQSRKQRAIHLHHIGQIEVEHVADRLFDRGMVAPDIEDAVAGEKIEVIAAIAIVEVRPFGACIDLVEADDALHLHKRGVEMPLVERIVFAQARLDELFEIDRHLWRPIYGQIVD